MTLQEKFERYYIISVHTEIPIYELEIVGDDKVNEFYNLIKQRTLHSISTQRFKKLNEIFGNEFR
jgi:hypothetical protein